MTSPHPKLKSPFQKGRKALPPSLSFSLAGKLTFEFSKSFLDALKHVSEYIMENFRRAYFFLLFLIYLSRGKNNLRGVFFPSKLIIFFSEFYETESCKRYAMLQVGKLSRSNWWVWVPVLQSAIAFSFLLLCLVVLSQMWPLERAFFSNFFALLTTK